jgi:hypothetical protein
MTSASFSVFLFGIFPNCQPIPAIEDIIIFRKGLLLCSYFAVIILKIVYEIRVSPDFFQIDPETNMLIQQKEELYIKDTEQDFLKISSICMHVLMRLITFAETPCL